MFAESQEAYVTYQGQGQWSAGFSLMLKAAALADGSTQAIEVYYNPSNNFVAIYTLDTNAGGWVYHDYVVVPLAVGDQLGARATADGVVQVYKNGSLMGSVDISDWGHNLEGGMVGLYSRTNDDNTIHLDDFGGGATSGEAGLLGWVEDALGAVADLFTTEETAMIPDLPAREEAAVAAAAASMPVGQVWTFYYSAHGQRVAMRVSGNADASKNGVFFLFGDHLGSTSVTYNVQNGTYVEMRYKPWGELRTQSGDPQTNYRYTGQRYDEQLGIYNYGARWYDPALGRFLSADTIVPQPGNPTSWDRYAYVMNNPVNATDPSGHCPFCVTAAIGAGIAAVVDYGLQVGDNLISGQSMNQALVNVDGAEIVGAAVAGGIAGGTLGLGTAALAVVGGTAATTGAIAVPVAAVAGGVGNALGGQAGALAEAGVRQIGNSKFDKDAFYSDAFDAGFLNADDFMWDLGSGAVLGAGGQAISNMTTPISTRYQFNKNVYKTLDGDTIGVPLNTRARLPEEFDQLTISGPVSGAMRNTSDWAQEILSQNMDRNSTREKQ